MTLWTQNGGRMSRHLAVSQRCAIKFMEEQLKVSKNHIIGLSKKIIITQ